MTGSITGNSAGFNARSIMKLSATFERVYLRDIGLKFTLKLRIEDALGRGQTLASFHAPGTLPSENDEVRME